MKTTLKKFQDIREHLNYDEDPEVDGTADPCTQSTAGMPRKRKLPKF